VSKTGFLLTVILYRLALLVAFLPISTCLFLFSGVSTSYGAKINLELAQQSTDNQVTLSVINHGTSEVMLERFRLEFNGRSQVIETQRYLSAGETLNTIFIVDEPALPGSYVQVATLFYRNDSRLLSLSHAGFFNFTTQGKFEEKAELKRYRRGRDVLLVLSADRPNGWKIVVPDEVVLSEEKEDNKKTRRFHLSGTYSGLRVDYPIFAVKERVVDGVQGAGIVGLKVSINHGVGETSIFRGRTPNVGLGIGCGISLALFILSITGSFSNRVASAAVSLFCSRLFFFSLSYLLLKNIHLLVTFSPLLIDHFTGKNYRYFFLYFVDIYFWGFVLLYIPYLLIIDKVRVHQQGRPVDDKYVACLLSLVFIVLWLPARLGVLRRSVLESFGQDDSKTMKIQSPLAAGWLLLGVKLFFLPLLSSWVIGNVIHQWNLLQDFTWSFEQINTFLLAWLILTDTSIFLFGYAFESRKLGSTIRSVEPTLLGWIVCLWCYPPFNSFSFTPFDLDLFPIHISISPWMEPVVLASVTLLWGIFVWASVALGFKASNLTNRGIVDSGPYRYCRHPAYTAKVVIWGIEAVFLGKYFVGLFISFGIIYLLRAWTEERHLSRDPDYLEYKERVRYWFIPGLI